MPLNVISKEISQAEHKYIESLLRIGFKDFLVSSYANVLNDKHFFYRTEQISYRTDIVPKARYLFHLKVKAMEELNISTQDISIL